MTPRLAAHVLGALDGCADYLARIEDFYREARAA